jgi:hypothetical protein
MAESDWLVRVKNGFSRKPTVYCLTSLTFCRSPKQSIRTATTRSRTSSFSCWQKICGAGHFRNRMSTLSL